MNLTKLEDFAYSNSLNINEFKNIYILNAFEKCARSITADLA